MTEADAFLQCIVESPWDDAPRLMFADWLEEYGQSERSEFIRVQCELVLLEGRCECNPAVGTAYCYACQKQRPLRHRERELLKLGWNIWHDLGKLGWSIFCHNLWPSPPCPTPYIVFRRGFIESITCAAAEWLTHGAAVLETQPIVEVSLASCPKPLRRDVGESADAFRERVDLAAHLLVGGLLFCDGRRLARIIEMRMHSRPLDFDWESDGLLPFVHPPAELELLLESTPGLGPAPIGLADGTHEFEARWEDGSSLQFSAFVREWGLATGWEPTTCRVRLRPVRRPPVFTASPDGANYASILAADRHFHGAIRR